MESSCAKLVIVEDSGEVLDVSSDAPESSSLSPAEVSQQAAMPLLLLWDRKLELRESCNTVSTGASWGPDFIQNFEYLGWKRCEERLMVGEKSLYVVVAAAAAAAPPRFFNPC
jgi:hypothetical protein